MKKIKLATMDPEKNTREIENFIIERVTTWNKTGGVIGLSGGIDSTTTATLAERAFKRYNQYHNKKLELVGYILPSTINDKKDAEDGIKVAKKLGIRYEVIEIQPILDSYRKTNPDIFKNKTEMGNLMSRIRANILSTKAAIEKKSVIGTGNRDEDFGIGYFTLFGDGAVHFSPIANLPKRLVKQIAGHIDVDKTLIDREPTAALEKNQTDFKDLGYSYDTVELIFEGLMQGLIKEELEEHDQIKEQIMKDFKKYKTTYGTLKLSSTKEVVEDFMYRHRGANGKAEIINPPKAEVSLKYD